MDDFAFLDAMAQAELVRKGQVTPKELVKAAIERLECLNPTLNLVVTPMYDLALEAAQRDLPQSPLAGVPFLLKDLIASYGGVRQTEGSAFLQTYVPEHDSELVRRLKRAGLIIMGKTNTPEFGNASTVEPVLFGPSRNPWNLDRTTGGSSGGSAAAVAAGMVSIAHGNDGGGSIRIPASCCGVFGLKPTRARNPLGPDYGDIFCGLVAEHALTRSVRDSAALLDVTSGYAPGDPYSAPPPTRPFFEEVGADPGRLRIAFSVVAPTGVSVHPDCRQAAYEAAELCTDLGHELVEAAPDLDAQMLMERYFMLWADGNAWMIDAWARRTGKTPTPDQFEPLTWALQKLGRSRSAAEHLLTLQDLQRAARDIIRFFMDYDVWLTPTLAEPPVPLGTFNAPSDNPLWVCQRDGEFTPFTPIANITGQPAMSVPLYWTHDGLPVGTHFVGRFGDEATLFRLAAQLEQARPWANLHPPVSAAKWATWRIGS